MNVLFAGPWDLAGKATAEYFLREGHEVCWLTQERNRTLWDSKFKGAVFRGVPGTRQILSFLHAHHIDVVIVLTAGLREGADLCSAEESEPLEKLLAALREHPVHSFVYLSSAELSWEAPLTPRQAALACGELSCRACQDYTGLPLLILRLGYLYGRAAAEDLGVTGAALQAIRRQQPIHCAYHPDDCIDVLTAADAAAAIYRMVLHTMTGCYLLVTGHPISLQNYYRCLERAAGSPARIEWAGERHTMEAARYSADPVKAATGWMPYTLFEEDGWQLLREVPDRSPSQTATLHKKRPRIPFPALRSVAEMLILFGITMLLLRFSKDVSDLKYVDIRLMFVALVSSCYGSGLGLAAVALACLSYLYSLAASYVDISYLLYSVDTWVPFVIYAVTGSVLGYMTGRRRDEAEELRRKNRLLAEKFDQLQDVQGETLEIKTQLQQRIVAERHSFADLYRIVQELDALDPPQILQHTVGIVEDLLQCGHVVVYRMGADGHSAELAACSESMQSRAPAIPDKEKLASLCADLDRQPVFVNTALVPGRPDLAAAIRCGDRLYGIVAAYELTPDYFTTYYRDLLKVVVGLIERDLVRALDVPHQKIARTGEVRV